MNTYDSTQDTNDHIARVQEIMGLCSKILDNRSTVHDQSKLKSPEKEIFDEYTPKLKNSTYGSEEYKGFLKGMGEALEHHYQYNSHHPENHDLWECPQCKAVYMRGAVPEVGYPSKEEYRWCKICFPEGYPGYFELALIKIPGINGMTLFDILEMVCDWKAATERHADGDIRRSLVINGNRFKISEQLSEILENTVNELEMHEWGKI
jgi:hypothetical protein